MDRGAARSRAGALADLAVALPQRDRPHMAAARRRRSRGRCCPRPSGRGRGATAGRCGRGRAWRGAAPASSSRPGRTARPSRDVGGKSPAMTLNSVVLPAPFGPRIARRSPGAISRSTSRTACRPPKRRPTPRKRRVGRGALGRGCASGAASVTYFWMTPLTTGFSLPTHGRLRFSQGGNVRPGGGDVCLNVPPNDWSTFGMYWTVLTSVFPGWAKIWYDHSPSIAWRFLSSLTVPNGVVQDDLAPGPPAAASGSTMLPLDRR